MQPRHTSYRMPLCSHHVHEPRVSGLYDAPCESVFRSCRVSLCVLLAMCFVRHVESLLLHWFAYF